MGGSKRSAKGGLVYHVLNRANARLTIFKKHEDYAAFEKFLEETIERFAMWVLAYTVMSNRWQLVLCPRKDGDLSRFTGWLTHTQCCYAHRRTIGSGHVCQDRFKSFPVQNDDHFLTLCRYVERNALRANLVRHAEDWRGCSLWRWKYGDLLQKSLLATWPLARRPGWLEHVRQALTPRKIVAIQQSLARGNPLGREDWSKRTIKRLGLESTIRPRGRPKMEIKGS